LPEIIAGYFYLDNSLKWQENEKRVMRSAFGKFGVRRKKGWDDNNKSVQSSTFYVQR